MEKEQLNLTATGLIINGTVWVNNLHVYLVPNKSQTISFWILEAVLLWKTICLGVQSHPEDQGDFGQGLTVNIWECNNQLELSVCVALTWYLLIPLWNLEFNSSLWRYFWKYCKSVQSHPGLRYRISPVPKINTTYYTCIQTKLVWPSAANMTVWDLSKENKTTCMCRPTVHMHVHVHILPEVSESDLWFWHCLKRTWFQVFSGKLTVDASESTMYMFVHKCTILSK